MTNNRKRCTMTYSQNDIKGIFRYFFCKDFAYHKYGTLELYVHMLIEDIEQQIFADLRNKQIMISASDNNSTDDIINIFNDNGYAKDMNNVICHFLDRGIIKILLIHGKCYFEIVYDQDDKPHFVPIYSNTVIKFSNKLFYQYIPKDIRKEKNLPIFNKLDFKRIFCISLPQTISKQLKDVCRKLARYDNMPSFVHDELLIHGNFAQYDMSYYKKMSLLFFASGTKEIGWLGRNTLEYKNISEYYQLHRRLQFQLFVVEIEKSIIDGLNKGLGEVGETLNKDIQIQVDTQQWETKLTNAQKALECGTHNFKDIVLM
jgi:hypothetical protein